MRQLFILLVATLTVTACSKGPFTEAMVLGGETVAAETLNLGHREYMLNCYACHGENGDGQGPAAAYLRPQPRDFRTGVFKFGGVRNPGLPHTQDLVELVQRGLTGTAMLPWDIPASELSAIVHYIKTFSSEAVAESAKKWTKGKKLGERIVPGDDPWKGRAKEAVAFGKGVYHIKAQCAKCHPAYVTQEEFYGMTRGDNEWAYGDLVYRSQLRKSDEFKGMKILPPDFLWHPMKTVAEGDDDVEQRRRLYRVIGAGIAGAAMPTWKGALNEEELWGLAYYLQSLTKMRDTKDAGAMRLALATQGAFDPNAPAGTTDQAAPAPAPESPTAPDAPTATQ